MFLDITLAIFCGVFATLLANGALVLYARFRARRRNDENPRSETPLPSRHRAVLVLALGTSFVLGLVSWNRVLGPTFWHHLIDAGDVDLLIHTSLWISFNPHGFQPTQSTPAPDDVLDLQLSWLQQAGFTGVITFGSGGPLSPLPRLAKRRGMATIVGVWDPTDEEELAIAIRQKEYADAYSVGHNGLNQLYDYEELERAIRYLRFRTWRPVTTTEKLDRYFVDERVASLGDWVFPDVHVPIRSDRSAPTAFVADAQRDAQRMLVWASSLSDLDAIGSRPILLKMVGYPMDGIPNASLEEQAEFFETLLETSRDIALGEEAESLPRNASIAFSEAFDAPWKRGWPFYPWDPYTGLFDPDGSPRPAVVEIVGRWPR